MKLFDPRYQRCTRYGNEAEKAAYDFVWMDLVRSLALMLERCTIQGLSTSDCPILEIYLFDRDNADGDPL